MNRCCSRARTRTSTRRIGRSSSRSDPEPWADAIGCYPRNHEDAANTTCWSRRLNTVSASLEERSTAVIEGIEAIDTEFVLHLPSSTLKLVLAHFLEQPGRCVFPIPREEEGISILAGLARH